MWERWVITKENLYRQIIDNILLDDIYRKNLPILLGSQLDIDEASTDFSIIFIENGGMCHAYVKEIIDEDNNWWGHPSRFNNPIYVNALESICKIFSEFRGIDKIFIRQNHEEYCLWDKVNRKKTELKLNTERYPLFLKRINSLASTNRSGDILFSAEPGYYFEDKIFLGEHGSLSITDSHVPLLVISPCLSKLTNKTGITEINDIVSTTMITPTIAETMGFYKNLISKNNEVNVVKSLQEINSNEITFLENEINILTQDFLGLQQIIDKTESYEYFEGMDYATQEDVTKPKEVYFASEVAPLFEHFNTSIAEYKHYLNYLQRMKKEIV